MSPKFTRNRYLKIICLIKEPTIRFESCNSENVNISIWNIKISWQQLAKFWKTIPTERGFRFRVTWRIFLQMNRYLYTRNRRTGFVLEIRQWVINVFRCSLLGSVPSTLLHLLLLLWTSRTVGYSRQRAYVYHACSRVSCESRCDVEAGPMHE